MARPRTKIKYQMVTRKECHYCDKLKDFMNTHNILFDEKDIMEPGVLGFMMQEGHTTVPQLFIYDSRYAMGLRNIGGYETSVSYLEDEEAEYIKVAKEGRQN